MNVVRTTEPLLEPITLAEAKAHCRVVDDEEEDAYLTALISVARRAVEDSTGRTLIDTVFTQTLREWCPVVNLLRGNAHTIVSIKYDDAEGGEQTVDAAGYGCQSCGDGEAFAAFYNEFASPDLVDRPFVDRIRIQFTAGYGSAIDPPALALAEAADLEAGNSEAVEALHREAVPQTLRQAVLYLVAHYYDNRSPVGINVNLNKMPFTVESLCSSYKIYN